MKIFAGLLFMLAVPCTKANAQSETPQQSLNHHVTFINQSVDVVLGRFKMLEKYRDDVELYKKKPAFLPAISSSGPLEEFYYNKTLAAGGLKPAEKQRLNERATAFWELVNKLDQTSKALETHVHLKSFQEDNLKRSDEYVLEIQQLFQQFSKEKRVFFQQIQGIYHRYQPVAADGYLNSEKMMEAILVSQEQLLDSLPYYADELNRTAWPVELLRKSMLEDEKLLAGYDEASPKIAYPASAALKSFKSALQSMQALKRNAIDNHNYAAQQSAKHGNAVYLSLLNQFNQDLIANHKSFVGYSQSARRLLDYVKFSPVVTKAPSQQVADHNTLTKPFQDKVVNTFATTRALAPASSAVVKTLNGYVGFINESLRQMHLLQVLLRNYQSSAEYHRDPAKSRQRAGLTYAHEDYKTPVAAYELLMNASSAIPQAYRGALNDQTQVLQSMLKEMDDLSIELIDYTTGKTYLKDNLSRSDAILDRYAYLFDTFDQKKEQLYSDVRRVHESYPNVNPSTSWQIAGNAMLETMDDDREIMFGVKDYLKGKRNQLPATDKLEAGARKLVADEYQNLKGLQRYGRSNGLCPYSPYEDLASNSTRFAGMAQKVKTVTNGSYAHPYQTFYYFYNNELVYQYNKFTELAKAGLLKMVNQPDVFAFRRQALVQIANAPENNMRPSHETIVREKPVKPVDRKEEAVKQERPKVSVTERPSRVERDTVYIERVRVDTIYKDRPGGQQSVTRTLEGFATNNMVLLLDVSASMNSPVKMPLLKRSIKSLLTLLRPEDKISIVVYSGKARVVLKPTSGSKAAEIARMIDLLQSSGDTEGNEGIRLAYKVANKEYIRSGNNRIVLATDGEFPVSEEVLDMIGRNASQDVYLSVLTFGKNQHNGQKLKKLSQLGQGTYAHVTEESADLQLIMEAQKEVER
jgi:Ca-activated chloride channel family protein